MSLEEIKSKPIEQIDRNLGWFKVDREFLISKDCLNDFLEVFRQLAFVPFDIKQTYSTSTLYYIGYSPHFDTISPAEILPQYDIIFHTQYKEDDEGNKEKIGVLVECKKAEKQENIVW